MTTKAADDFEAIRRRLEEIKAEKNLALTGSTIKEEPKKEIDWTNVGWRKDYGLSSLAQRMSGAGL